MITDGESSAPGVVTEPRQCIFCGAEGKLTREHLFPQWLNDAFPQLQGTPTDYSITKEKGGEQERKAWQAALLTHTVNACCASCNGGWMSNLESRSQKVLLAMARGSSRLLPPLDQLLLATWATKTAMVAEFMFDEPVLFTSEDRRIVMNEDRPPANTQVALAAGEFNGLPVAFYRTLYEVQPAARSETLIIPPGVRGLPGLAAVSTIVAGCVVFQVFVEPASKGQHFAMPAQSNAQLATIVPPSTSDINWPPSRPLNDNTLPSFIERFGPSFNFRRWQQRTTG